MWARTTESMRSIIRDATAARASAMLLAAMIFAACDAHAGDIISDMHPRNWTAPSLDDAFTILPCRAFQKNADGSWTLLGTLTIDNGDTFTNKTVAGDDRARDLDSRCGEQE